jgi:predicted DNA binding CopG/RHH family protein
MKKQLKKLPVFQSEDDERAFWSVNDSSEYYDLNEMAPVVFPNLKPSTKSISIRLPEMMLSSIKAEANKRDIPYQSLIKVWLNEKLDKAA